MMMMMIKSGLSPGITKDAETKLVINKYTTFFRRRVSCETDAVLAAGESTYM